WRLKAASNGLRKPTLHNSQVLPLRIDLVDAAGGWPDAVKATQNREQAVLAPQHRHARPGQRSDQFRHVTADDIERLAVRTEQDRVGAMLDLPDHLTQELGRLESVAAILRGDAVQTAFRPHSADVDILIDHDI